MSYNIRIKNVARHQYDKFYKMGRSVAHMRSYDRLKLLIYVVGFCTLLMALISTLKFHFFMRPSYDYIAKDDVLRNLHEELAKNFTSSAISDCQYFENVYDETTLSPSLVDGDLIENHRIKDGGEYSPAECKPKYSTAIIVPYRDRAEQLRGFLVYMHMFLRHQRIHYRIYVVEQMDTQPFNRGKLLNIGAVAAMKAGYPCIILHNVDLLPLKPANLYVCTKRPRHMSSSTSRLSYMLPSLGPTGGVVAMVSKQFNTINGMSNEYFGWGGEDDDLFERMRARGMKVCRFEPDLSRYHLMTYERNGLMNGYSNKVKQLLSTAKVRMSKDGLNSLKYTEVATVLHPLFSHIMVDL